MSNKDEALRAREVAEEWMRKADFTAARRFAKKAQQMDASLEKIVSPMILVCDVHCAALEKSGDETDWYKILQVEQNADDNAIKKQYRKLVLHLHPDKSKLPGAESAFKFVGEAYEVLSNKDERRLHDMKRKPAPAPSFKPQQAPTTPVFTQRFQTNDTLPFIYVNVTRKMPENQKKTQAQPTGFGGQTQETFQVPPVQATFPIFQQNNVPTQEAAKAAEKKPENSAKISSTKEGFTVNNGKRKIETIVVSISSDSSCECEEVPAGGQHSRRSVRSKQQVSYKENKSDDDNKEEDAESESVFRKKSHGGQHSRRSVRSKQQVSYKENKSDDDNKEEDAETESVFRKKSHQDQLFAETLPNGINRTKKIKKNQVGSSRDSGARNVAKDSSSGRFSVSVSKSYLKKLLVPASFVKRYLPRKNTMFKIRKADGKKSWDVHYCRTESLGYQCYFTGGWRQLCKEYPVAVGDTCEFTLINPNELNPNELVLIVSKPK